MFQSLPVPYLTGFKISQNDALRWMMEMFYSSHIPDNDPWVGVSQKSFPVCLVWFDDDNSVKLRDRTLSIACWHLPPDSATFGYATEGALFISVQLSTGAVSALQKVWVLIRLWKLSLIHI